MGGSQAAYRVRQFWHALTARPDVDQLDFAAQILMPPLFELFQTMQFSEQAHAVKVGLLLKEQGYQELDLLAAALLHDVGKARYPLRLWERVWIVLGQRFAPGFVSHLMREAVDGGKTGAFHRAFLIAEQHPAWGAEIAAQCGASPLVVTLIRRHQDQKLDDLPEDTIRLLSALQAADNEN